MKTPGRGSGRGLTASILGWAVIAFAAPAAAAQAIPGEMLVTPQRDLLDPEFSQPRNKVAWVDRGGGLWIADVDPATGLFVPADGKGSLVDG